MNVRKHVDVSFAPETWQKVIAGKRRPGKLVCGDVAAVGSEAYANWQSQLLSWEACHLLRRGRPA
ncbi:hypothetical protein ACIBO5_24240 [Nonomuraea angiospora]|uniref:hypothetical protein n=1 Tax=Nonomuraea angiospora TaxID=46172 RepID=UPI0029AD7DB4|nr:hypothetical protein [Nonomuraea angiospora]MDX3101705.1 hypothetical protein [Nonomuraea angiospora]